MIARFAKHGEPQRYLPGRGSVNAWMLPCLVLNTHLISQEKAQRALEIKLGVGKTSSHCHHTGGEQTFYPSRSDEVLHIRRQSERYSIVRLVTRSLRVEGCRDGDSISKTPPQKILLVNLLANSSVIKIKPVFKLKWKRLGLRLLRQATYDKKTVEAVCNAKCFRISHRDEGSDIVRIMY